MDVMAAIYGRRSVRAFLPDPPSRADLEQIIAAAGWAPSPHGRQPWRFALVIRAALKAELATAMAETWRAQMLRDGVEAGRIAANLQRSQTQITSAPVIVVPCLYLEDLDVYPDDERQRLETLMAVQSLGCAIQNMLLSAYALGLGTGWMAAPLFCPDVVRTTLDLASNLHPQAFITLGYVAKEPLRRPRLSPAQLVVRWE